MNTFKTLAASAAVLMTLAATPLLAQEQPPAPQGEMHDQGGGWWGKGHGHGKNHGEGRGGRGMRMIDANSDGMIGADEAAAMADRMFMRMDEDRDGSLTEAEYSTPPRGKRWFGWGQAEADAVLKVRKEKFAALDTVKDGKLSKAEFFVESQQMFASADTDKDGKVTPWEFRAVARP